MSCIATTVQAGYIISNVCVNNQLSENSSNTAASTIECNQIKLLILRVHCQNFIASFSLIFSSKNKFFIILDPSIFSRPLKKMSDDGHWKEYGFEIRNSLPSSLAQLHAQSDCIRVCKDSCINQVFESALLVDYVLLTSIPKLKHNTHFGHF